jgi:hypothetical protein
LEKESTFQWSNTEDYLEKERLIEVVEEEEEEEVEEKDDNEDEEQEEKENEVVEEKTMDAETLFEVVKQSEEE